MSLVKLIWQKNNLLRSLLIGCGFLWLLALPKESAALGFFAYDSPTANMDHMFAYDLFVLNSQRHPPLEPLTERAKTVLAHLYISAVEGDSLDISYLEKAGLLKEKVQPDAKWLPVKLAEPEWLVWFVEVIVVRAVRAGFQGIFVDTAKIDLDNEEVLSSAVNLIMTVNLHYPRLQIMIRDNHRLYNALVETVDMVLAESLFTRYDEEEDRYYRVANAERTRRVELLYDMQKTDPDLVICTLDYWDPEEIPGKHTLEKEIAKLGFNSLVTSSDLDWLPSTPP